MLYQNSASLFLLGHIPINWSGAVACKCPSLLILLTGAQQFGKMGFKGVRVPHSVVLIIKDLVGNFQRVNTQQSLETPLCFIDVKGVDFSEDCDGK